MSIPKIGQDIEYVEEGIMNPNNLFNNEMNSMLMPGIGPLLPNQGAMNTYGPYEGFIRGNLFKDLYDPYKNYQPAKLIPNSEQEERLLNLDQLAFAAHELNLYLDIHPDDRNALNEFNRYRKMAIEAMNTYENQYGPLSVDSDTLEAYPWAWEGTTWPWEREAN